MAFASTRPLCILGATGESLFSTQRGRGFYFLAVLAPKNKGAGQGARQGVAVDAARLGVNEGRRGCCGLFATTMTAQG